MRVQRMGITSVLSLLVVFMAFFSFSIIVVNYTVRQKMSVSAAGETLMPNVGSVDGGDLVTFTGDFSRVPYMARYIKSCMNGDNYSGGNGWREIIAYRKDGAAYNENNVGNMIDYVVAGTSPENPAYPYSNIIDKNAATAGMSSEGGLQCVTLDYTTEYDLHGIRIVFAASSGARPIDNTVSVGLVNKPGTEPLDQIIWSYSGSSGPVAGSASLTGGQYQSIVRTVNIYTSNSTAGACSIETITAGQLTCVTSRQTQGRKNAYLRLTKFNNEATLTMSSAFWYVNIAPRGGGVRGGEEISITGLTASLINGTVTAKIGGVWATDVALSGSTLKMKAPPHDIGKVPIEVFNNGVLVYSTAPIYSYYNSDPYRVSTTGGVPIFINTGDAGSGLSNYARYVKNCIHGNSINEGNHWNEIMVYSGGVNVALGKLVTGTVPPAPPGLNHYGKITDGDSSDNSYGAAQAGYQCVTVDLGQIYKVDSVQVVHYGARDNPRRYYLDDTMSIGNTLAEGTELLDTLIWRYPGTSPSSVTTTTGISQTVPAPTVRVDGVIAPASAQGFIVPAHAPGLATVSVTWGVTTYTLVDSLLYADDFLEFEINPVLLELLPGVAEVKASEIRVSTNNPLGYHVVTQSDANLVCEDKPSVVFEPLLGGDLATNTWGWFLGDVGLDSAALSGRWTTPSSTKTTVISTDSASSTIDGDKYGLYVGAKAGMSMRPCTYNGKITVDLISKY